MEKFLSFCNLLMFFCGDFILCICERMPLILFLSIWTNDYKYYICVSLSAAELILLYPAVLSFLSNA